MPENNHHGIYFAVLIGNDQLSSLAGFSFGFSFRCRFPQLGTFLVDLKEHAIYGVLQKKGILSEVFARKSVVVSNLEC